MGKYPKLHPDWVVFRRRIEEYIAELRKKGIIKKYDSMHERAIFFAQMQRWYHWKETGKNDF